MDSRLRGCVKTLLEAYFGGRRTITEVPIVDPGASNELDNFHEPSISEFSHSLAGGNPCETVRYWIPAFARMTYSEVP